MILNILIIAVAAILLSLCYVVNEVRQGKYKVGKNSIVEEESIEAFKKEFPEKEMKDLKIEIEKISDMLLDNQESNRYTAKIQEKAKNDFRLNAIRNLMADSVEIIRYKDRQLKAKVNYNLPNETYSLIMEMEIVKKGRAFLKKYNIIKYIINSKNQEIY